MHPSILEAWENASQCLLLGCNILIILSSPASLHPRQVGIACGLGQQPRPFCTYTSVALLSSHIRRKLLSSANTQNTEFLGINPCCSFFLALPISPCQNPPVSFGSQPKHCAGQTCQTMILVSHPNDERLRRRPLSLHPSSLFPNSSTRHERFMLNRMQTIVLEHQ